MRVKVKSSWHVVLMLFTTALNAQTVDALYQQNRTPEYKEVISFYKNLDAQYKNARLFTEGLTDVGLPLHVFVITSDGDFSPASIKQKNKAVLLINNGIHPGEPDGIDASMVLSKRLLSGDPGALRNTVVCIIPVYNIDGVLNRGCCSRANQNGPEQYGFRGNAQNLDLNRDFIKCDSRNAQSFTSIFQKWDPDVFIDTHVSDGADYQYVLTLIATQKDKLTPSLGQYLDQKMLPEMYRLMKEQGEEMSPYVDTYKETPDSGLVGFLETPRFATGYAALFNTLGFTTETHMLKPYTSRVESTIRFLDMIVAYAGSNSSEILLQRKKAKQECELKQQFPLAWVRDTTKADKFLFKGYEAAYKPSVISGFKRLHYNREKPYTKEIDFWNTYRALLTVQKPKAYVIPQCWQKAVERLKLNEVQLTTLKSDTVINVTAYYIVDFKTSPRAYEGHYLHSQVKVRRDVQQLKFYKGDYLVNTSQERARYIVETMEPEATDSYFNWGFFDPILQQKEWFSDYVFEDMAEQLLEKDSVLRSSFNEAKAKDKAMVEDHFQQLYFIYKNSPYFEKSYMRYPVYRIE